VSRDRASKGEEMKAEETGLPRSEISALIDEWIFSARDRNIMRLRWLDGLRYDDIADEMELSTRHVKNIVYKCENILFKHI
jgi:DNA-directed RNA polymerase specialized sigma24 family protein